MSRRPRSHRQRRRGMRSLNGIPEGTRSRRTPQIRDPRRLRGLVAQSCHVEGLSEKAATPGCPEPRRNAFPENPPGNSPSRTAGNHQLCRTLQQGLRHLTYAVRALCKKGYESATENWCSFVRKLWTAGIVCGRDWKTGKKLARGHRGREEFQRVSPLDSGGRLFPRDLQGRVGTPPPCEPA